MKLNQMQGRRDWTTVHRSLAGHYDDRVSKKMLPTLQYADHSLCEGSMGNILAAQTERGVCAILIGDDAEQLVRALQDRFPKATLAGDAAEYQDLVAKVVGLVENPKSGFGLPLDI